MLRYLKMRFMTLIFSPLMHEKVGERLQYMQASRQTCNGEFLWIFYKYIFSAFHL